MIKARAEEAGNGRQTATELCPAQQVAFERLLRVFSIGNVCVLYGNCGLGRTTVLHRLRAETGGAFLNMKDFTEAIRSQHPTALEETFERLVLEALAQHEVVIVDDLHLLTCVAGGCNHFYPRNGLLNAPLSTIATLAAETGRKVIFGTDGAAPGPVHERCHYGPIEAFKAEDYQFLCRGYLGEERAGALDYHNIFRFARELNAHQLKAVGQWFSNQDKGPTTDQFIDYLRSQRLSSNVDLGEVQAVDLHDLRGIDDVIESLEANIIVPLENDALAAELNLKPKRGVLLAGPAGTGKTTIGRALAHRLKSKFFLLDGTFIAGTRDFYQKVHHLFEMAKQNAPSIIFIDDSDVLFENREDYGPGLYRYLLTLLDGLESETAGRVCVMLTVMDIGGLPPALVRSGRVELWLDMRLPDEQARTEILQQHLSGLPPTLQSVDVARLASATDGFTGADLKRLVEDGKALFAYDKARGLPSQPITEYFLSAIETVRANKQRYAEAEARARPQRAGIRIFP
jgi:DNA replication protein DnaC